METNVNPESEMMGEPGITDEAPGSETPVSASPTAESLDPVTGEAQSAPTEDIDEAPATLDELELSDSDMDEGAAIAAAAAAESYGYQTRINELLREIEVLKIQGDERMNQYARLSADFENFRKRNQKEREEMEVRIKCDTLRDLLPVVDNFERARSHIKPQTDVEMNIHKSYQGIYKQLVDGFKRLGVSPMRPEGQEFDPNFHDAVMREQTNEYPEGTVTEELQRGYMLGEQVLRHAMVKVAAPLESVVAPEESSDTDAES